MDMASMLRTKAVEGATTNLAAYLINNQSMPDDLMAPVHRGALEVSESSVISSSPGRKNICIAAVVLDTVLPQRTLVMISRRAKVTRLAADAPHVLDLTAMILKKLNNTTMNFAVLIA
jgi:hypothetical protein